eukprot:scaffold88072_cov60-Phaeocystis_antarctica.AAC.1
MLGASAPLRNANDDDGWAAGWAATTSLQAAPWEEMVHRPLTVIFLDIDGVICTNSKGKPIVRDVLLEQLKRIVLACDAKVVLSTDWRRISYRKELAERKLACKGIECVGATPYSRILRQDANVRPKEIAAWLSEHGRNVTSWVAIDDRLLTDEVGGDFVVGHCVTTEFSEGLTAERADEAIQLLQGHEVWRVQRMTAQKSW